MVREAQAAGFEVTERLVTDWSSLGLLDHPERRSKGKGQVGAPATCIRPISGTSSSPCSSTARQSGRGPLTVLPVGHLAALGRRLHRSAPGAPGLVHVDRAESRGSAPSSGPKQMAKTGGAGAGDTASAEPEAKATLDAALTDVVFNRTFDRDAVSPLVRAVVDPKGNGRTPWSHRPDRRGGHRAARCTHHRHDHLRARKQRRLHRGRNALPPDGDQLHRRLAPALSPRHIGALFERPSLEFFINRCLPGPVDPSRTSPGGHRCSDARCRPRKSGPLDTPTGRPAHLRLELRDLDHRTTILTT